MGVRVSRGVCWTNPMVEKQESRESEFCGYVCSVCWEVWNSQTQYK